ncbi:MAG: hypothetical protein FJ340_04385 [Sphingomonadales bacterium]|jgi:hypothetical protein|nr:hypothetical protein [Sphingomonadales bacterium]
MKKTIQFFGVLLLCSTLMISCSKKASDYDNLVKEYKKVLCIVMDKNNSSMSEKTKALQRQQELNTEYQEALTNLSQEEKSKLLMSWANAVAEVGDGKCD